MQPCIVTEVSITRQFIGKPALHCFNTLDITDIDRIPNRGTVFKYWSYINRKSTEQQQWVTTFKAAQYQYSSLVGFSYYVIVVGRETQ